LALAEYELYLKITHVKGITTETKRSLAFSRTEISSIPTDELIIEITRHEYTPEYTELTKALFEDVTVKQVDII
jgi:tRNA1Val (adenine37-N6)-methyltransferase